VSISRDLREITSRFEELTARIDVYSDSGKRLRVSMAKAKNVESINTVRSRKLSWLATQVHGISMDVHEFSGVARIIFRSVCSFSENGDEISA
jgi:hypothetical protein